MRSLHPAQTWLDVTMHDPPAVDILQRLEDGQPNLSQPCPACRVCPKGSSLCKGVEVRPQQLEGHKRVLVGAAWSAKGQDA